MAIRDWRQDDRPREKLLEKGPAALSDAELLAILLRTGVRGKSALDLARELLESFGSITGLYGATLAEFRRTPGLGQAKYVQIQAAMELARRTLREDIHAREYLSSPVLVRDYLRLLLQHEPVEVFIALYLDAQNRLIGHEELFRGTLTQTSVFPREVVRHALARNCAGVIFAHNHPSGVAEPSRADELLTRALKDALALVDVKVVDHFVVGRGEATSFAERGLL